MQNSLKESLDYIRVSEAEAIPVPTGALGKAGQLLGRAAPGIGLGIGAYDVYHRQKAGDTTGAAISGATAAASTIPIIGTAASILGMGVQALRDKIRTGSFLPGEEELVAAAIKDAKEKQSNTPLQTQPTAPTQTTKPGFDPKVKALQDKILAKDPNALPKYGADGLMGGETQAAMKKYGITAESNGDISMSESEKIAALRVRLTQLESQAQDTNEGVWDSLGKFASGVGKGIANPAATNLKNVAAGTTASTKGIKTGAAVARNPGKVAAGAATTGALGTAAMMGGGAEPAQAQPSTPTGGAAGGGGAVKPPAPSGGVDQKALDELDQLARIIGKSQDKSAIELMGQYNAIRKGLPAATTVAGEMDESIARYIKLVDGN